MGQEPSEIRREIEETRERMGDTVEALAYKADVKTRTKDAMSEKVETVKSKFSGAAGTVSDATPNTADVKATARRAGGMVQENPLGLAIGSMAVGFIGGLLIPSTRMEDEKIGPVADQVKEQVKETAQTAVEHGKQVAQDAADAAKESGKEHAEQARQEISSSS